MLIDFWSIFELYLDNTKNNINNYNNNNNNNM